MGGFRTSKITTRLVEGLAPNQTVMDSALPGFGVRRQGDARVYFVRKHANGRRHYATIGEHGQEGWTEAKARNAALLVIAALRQGRDPAAERTNMRGMPTLAEFGDSFIEQHIGKLKPGTLANYRSLLHTHIAPRDQRGTLKVGCLGRLRLDQVTHQEIAALHRQLQNTPRAANHVLAFVSSLFSEAQAANLVPENFNPTRRVRRYAVQSRQRFLTESELARVGEVLTQAETDGSEDPYAVAAIRLLIFTGCRRDEILDARWSWIDFERGLLNLPDSKTGAKPVLLSPAAIEALKNLARVEGNPFVIVGKRAGQRWVNLRKVWVRIRERADLDPDVLATGKVQQVRLHDLRHSFASLLASGGASLPMIGKLLGHKNHQTTARYSHLSDDPLRRLSEDVGRKVARSYGGGRVWTNRTVRVMLPKEADWPVLGIRFPGESLWRGVFGNRSVSLTISTPHSSFASMRSRISWASKSNRQSTRRSGPLLSATFRACGRSDGGQPDRSKRKCLAADEEHHPTISLVPSRT